MKRLLTLLLAGLTCLTACKSKVPAVTTPRDTAITVQSEQPSSKPETVDFSPMFAPKERNKNAKINELTPDGKYITGNYTTVDTETVQKYPRLTNQPTLYLEFPNGKNLSSVQHQIYSPATYTFVDEYVEDCYYNLPLQIKGRGNASWGLTQKAYGLKLDEKADFLDMGAAKKWVLISVGSDMSMMRNYLTQKLAAAMGLPYTCENEYLDVVVNGEYKGTWVLTEKIQIHEERVDISEDTGVLFEIEMTYRHTCDVCVTLNSGGNVHLTLQEYKGLDVEDMTRNQKIAAQRELKAYFDPLNAAIYNTTSSIKELSKYIDIDSFVNWYLLNELTRNYDSQFVTSCYCFIGDDGKLYMGPVWDFDSCYGNQSDVIDGYHVKNAPWYTALLDNKEFKDLADKRWTEIRENGLLDAFYNAIGQTAIRIAQSEKLNHTLYPTVAYRNEPFDDAVAYFEYWLEARIEWMDGQFLLPNPPFYVPPVTTTAQTTRPRPKPRAN